MIELADPKMGEIMADLGSGDGRILIEFAKRGVEAYGFELDKDLVEKSCILIHDAGFVSKITVFQKDFWAEHLGGFDIITMYPMPDIMQGLEEKLLKETKPNARILLNYYPLPTIEPTFQGNNIFLYSGLNG